VLRAATEMPNHPNRGPQAPFSNPAPAAIRAARDDAGLTQTQAAGLVHGTLRAWQEWEAGNRRMHPGLWELYRIKLALIGSLRSRIDRVKI
jgi:putative transcriptional regulator